MKCPYCARDPRHGVSCRNCGATVEWAPPPEPMTPAGDPKVIREYVKAVMECYMPYLEDRVIERLRELNGEKA